MVISPDYEDQAVLDQTLKKIVTLNKSITSSLAKVSAVSSSATRELEPLDSNTTYLDTFEANLNAAWGAVQDIKPLVMLVAKNGPIIKEGPDSVGILNYVKAVEETSDIYRRASLSPKLYNYELIMSRLQSLEDTGRRRLKDYLKDTFGALYKPFDSAQFASQHMPFPTLDAKKSQNIRDFLSITKNDSPVEKTYLSSASNYITQCLSQQAQKIKMNQHGRDGALKLYTEAMCQHLDAEVISLKNLFGADSPEVVSCLEQLSTTLIDTFSQAVRSQPLTDENFAVFECIDCVYILDQGIRRNVQPLQSQRGSQGTFGEYKKLGDLIEFFSDNAFEVLKSFLVQIVVAVREDPFPMSTAQATARTTLTLAGKVDRLSKFVNQILVTLEKRETGSWRSGLINQNKVDFIASNGPVPDSPPDKLANFFCDAFECQLNTLEAKGKGEKKPNPFVGYVLLINLEVIKEAVEKRNLMRILGEWGGQRMRKMNKKAQDLFTEGWASMIHEFAMSGARTMPGQKAALSRSERDSLKKKFEKFNIDLDNLMQTHRSYAIKDVKLSLSLVQDISKLVMPVYRRMYDQHIGGDFTKHVEKYIKFDPPTLNKMIQDLANPASGGRSSQGRS